MSVNRDEYEQLSELDENTIRIRHRPVAILMRWPRQEKPCD